MMWDNLLQYGKVCYGKVCHDMGKFVKISSENLSWCGKICHMGKFVMGKFVMVRENLS